MESNVAMNSRACAFVLLVALLALSGCNGFDHDYNTPEPSTLDHHTHVAILHFRTINHSGDTLGIVAAFTSNGYLSARRDASPKISRSWAVPSYLPQAVQIVFSDTASHACTLEMEHFVGYQTRYGGDTTRFSAMDRYGAWTLDMAIPGTRVAFENGETLDIFEPSIAGIPDTVRPGEPYELDITVDLDGLLAWQASQGRYNLQPDHLVVRQR